MNNTNSEINPSMNGICEGVIDERDDRTRAADETALEGYRVMMEEIIFKSGIEPQPHGDRVTLSEGEEMECLPGAIKKLVDERVIMIEYIKSHNRLLHQTVCHYSLRGLNEELFG